MKTKYYSATGVYCANVYICMRVYMRVYIHSVCAERAKIIARMFVKSRRVRTRCYAAFECAHVYACTHILSTHSLCRELSY